MAKESKSGTKPAAKKTTTKKTTVKKATTKSASASKTTRPKRTKSAVSKTTTKSAGAKKATTKAKKPVLAAVGAGGAPPMVDTNFAAEAAARMLATRAKLAKATGSAVPSDAGGAAVAGVEAHRESGMFKQMKESINKPAAGGISSAMGNTFGPNKTNLPNPDKGHVVRDQTTSNVNRINVPRRTGG